LSQVVSKLADLYRPTSADRQHELNIELEPQVIVYGDLSLINRTIGNLLDNEIAHLPCGCRIRIRLCKQGDTAELVIQDDGPGFPPEITSHAFERFVKGKHSAGHGLGLAFVNAVVQAHGGAVTIGKGPGGGALIRLSLPVVVLQMDQKVK
jgi:signal transduction histidine kinase